MLGPRLGFADATGGQGPGGADGGCCCCCCGGGTCCGTGARPGAGPTPGVGPPRSTVSSIRARFESRRRVVGRRCDVASSSSSSEPSTDIAMGAASRGLRTRMSLRMRILIPWSASEHESGVDSAWYQDQRWMTAVAKRNAIPSMPGNFFAVYT